MLLQEPLESTESGRVNHSRALCNAL